MNYGIKRKKKTYIQESFIGEIEVHLLKYQTLMKEYDDFSPLFSIDPTRLEEALKSKSLLESLKNPELSFNETYVFLIEDIQNRCLPIKTELAQEDMVVFETISQQYFNHKKPEITVEDIQSKKVYLVHTRNNQSKVLKHQQETAKKKLEEKKLLLENRLQLKIDEIANLRSIYTQSIHNFNTDFLKDIKVPLFLISGRIMQTSPIGLGIEAKITDRRFEFLTGTVSHDVVNMLSAGQLNGLMISIMLAVQKTYLSSKGVKFFMIDDPLQSIDDLSAHSFVDLLTQEFRNNQILISTHELEKTAMFYYKYDQAGIPFSRKNLQYEYLK